MGMNSVNTSSNTLSIFFSSGIRQAVAVTLPISFGVLLYLFFSGSYNFLPLREISHFLFFPDIYSYSPVLSDFIIQAKASQLFSNIVISQSVFSCATFLSEISFLVPVWLSGFLVITQVSLPQSSAGTAKFGRFRVSRGFVFYMFLLNVPHTRLMLQRLITISLLQSYVISPPR